MQRQVLGLAKRGLGKEHPHTWGVEGLGKVQAGRRGCTVRYWGSGARGEVIG